ncbi:hypothetical protein BV898_12457 [Hypsibius exemplaris]|uniref:tRNA-intron lyase n=1 Tax=Hypsibius exemplaris TaxID=2072580 RepID=A0A1W0WDV0_HYPEX|nr:hypothetical protein BV898_12457 [Hypsibius exemplaris]
MDGALSASTAAHPSKVNYKFSVVKQGRRNVTSTTRGNLNERFGIPYPYPHENIRLKGLLVDSKVYLYDMTEYNFLRFHRGFFGDYNYVTPFEMDRPKPQNYYRSDRDTFPPTNPNVFPIASLNLLEAYFLNFICGSLEIWDGVTQLQLLRQNLMGLFTQLDPLFPYMFAAYVYFRRQKKYTVKSGLKFGTDFALYEYGPSRTHSLYSAHVIVPGIRDSGVSVLDAMQRACNTVKKDVLLVEVVASGLSADDLLAPDSFVKMEIREVIIRRRETLTSQKSDPADSNINSESHAGPSMSPSVRSGRARSSRSGSRRGANSSRPGPYCHSRKKNGRSAEGIERLQ